jgi:hypothetical protein
MKQGLELLPSLGPDECVQFVNYEVRGMFENSADRRPSVAKQRFKGLRSDEKNAMAFRQELGFYRCRDIPVPRPDRDVQLLAQPLEPTKLVVDKRFERADVGNKLRPVSLKNVG